MSDLFNSNEVKCNIRDSCIISDLFNLWIKFEDNLMVVGKLAEFLISYGDSSSLEAVYFLLVDNWLKLIRGFIEECSLNLCSMWINQDQFQQRASFLCGFSHFWNNTSPDHPVLTVRVQSTDWHILIRISICIDLRLNNLFIFLGLDFLFLNMYRFRGLFNGMNLDPFLIHIAFRSANFNLLCKSLLNNINISDHDSWWFATAVLHHEESLKFDDIE